MRYILQNRRVENGVLTNWGISFQFPASSPLGPVEDAFRAMCKNKPRSDYRVIDLYGNSPTKMIIFSRIVNE